MDFANKSAYFDQCTFTPQYLLAKTYSSLCIFVYILSIPRCVKPGVKRTFQDDIFLIINIGTIAKHCVDDLVHYFVLCSSLGHYWKYPETMARRKDGQSIEPSSCNGLDGYLSTEVVMSHASSTIGRSPLRSSRCRRKEDNLWRLVVKGSGLPHVDEAGVSQATGQYFNLS